MSPSDKTAYLSKSLYNRGFWDLYEVKSSTSVKEHYWDDVAVQYYVLSGCGLPINKAYLWRGSWKVAGSGG